MKNFFIPTRQNGFLPYSLRKGALTVYTLSLLLLNLFFGVLSTSGPTEVSASSITAANLIAYANQERTNNGLNQLNANSKLTAAAYAKASDMLDKDYWSHYGPNGETPWQFILGSGYSYVHAGENLAKGFSTSEGVHQAWMASPTHRANILSGNYNDIGIAVVEGELQGVQTVLVVQMFGSLSDSQPSAPAAVAAPTPGPAQPIEKGEIKSISISRPEAGSTITDSSISVEGSVRAETSLQGSYSVEIYQDTVRIASTESENESWSAQGEGKWEDGEITVTARLDHDETLIEESVTFSVDTIAPQFDKSSATVIFESKNAKWEFSFIPSEENLLSAIKISEESTLLTDNGDGFWVAAIDDSALSQGEIIELTLTDQHGNSSTFDVTSLFVKEESEVKSLVSDQESGDSRFVGMLSLLNNVDARSKANFMFVGFIFILLLVQVYHYHRLRMLDQKGGYLFTLGVWVFILLLLSSVGAVGELA